MSRDEIFGLIICLAFVVCLVGTVFGSAIMTALALAILFCIVYGMAIVVSDLSSMRVETTHSASIEDIIFLQSPLSTQEELWYKSFRDGDFTSALYFLRSRSVDKSIAFEKLTLPQVSRLVDKAYFKATN